MASGPGGWYNTALYRPVAYSCAVQMPTGPTGLALQMSPIAQAGVREAVCSSLGESTIGYMPISSKPFTTRQRPSTAQLRLSEARMGLPLPGGRQLAALRTRLVRSRRIGSFSPSSPPSSSPSFAPVAVATATAPGELSTDEGLELTEENVEMVLDEVRPYLMADGGDVELYEIDGLTVKLRLKGACGSCPSSSMTMRMGLERRLIERIPEIQEVEQVMDAETGLPLTEENVEKVLAEIRPYLSGTGGGDLELVKIDGPLVKVAIGGPAAGVMTVRVAVTQKLREKIPSIAAVQLL
eukprot:TRINITY_DN3235_c0_g1_i1.p1 TRINITY_DN3235_c0_g1~~TRINITY_DN3235_c0_g1_i1.p1  ORF type:complete len:296 (+),score=57.27 TRINITY_DN3235_c0_g1_i1:208-1095(+)